MTLPEANSRRVCDGTDNFRIFCETKREAKVALKKLSQELRRQGLNLQRTKTQIMSSIEAEKKLQEPDRIISQITPSHPTPTRTFGSQGRGGSPYDGGNGGQSHRTDGGENTEIELESVEIEESKLVRTFKQEFIDSSNDFNKYLFRFLIPRLGKLDNDIAVNYCINRITEGKTEVRHILDRYFSRLSDKREIGEKLATLVDENRLLYNFHRFVLFRWFWSEKIESIKILNVARDIVEDRSYLIETKRYAIAYIGEFGKQADLESIKQAYNDHRDEISRAVIICSLNGMEPSRKGKFYNKAEKEGFYTNCAVNYAKQID